MVVAHFFESGSDAVYVGPSRERTLMAGAVALAARYIAAIDEKAGGHVGRPASRFPQREPALPTETAREQSTEAQGRVILLDGAGSQPVAAPGQAVVRRTVP